MNAERSKLGPPAHYIHVIWLAASADDPRDYYDELDANRWSIRCVRLYRDGTREAFSYESPNWRHVMPEAAIDEPDVINRDTQFLARSITRDAFAAAWQEAQSKNPLQFNIFDNAGQSLCLCCGLAGQFSDPPDDARGGRIGCGICACCFWEPGFDDHPGASALATPTIKASVVAYRARWIALGYPWRAEKSQPVGWDGRSQCEALLRRFPHLGA
jgi:hypothetical protein